MSGVYLGIPQFPQLVDSFFQNRTASRPEVALEPTEMRQTLMDVVLPVVIQSRLECTLHILRILESDPLLLQENVGFVYHGRFFFFAGLRDSLNSAIYAGVLSCPRLLLLGS